jgi:hypothetical protein
MTFVRVHGVLAGRWQRGSNLDQIDPAWGCRHKGQRCGRARTGSSTPAVSGVLIPHRDTTVHSGPKIGQLSQKIARKEQCDARYADRDRPDPEYAWGLGKAEGEA